LIKIYRKLWTPSKADGNFAGALDAANTFDALETNLTVERNIAGYELKRLEFELSL
jgi:hypothetical protein